MVRNTEVALKGNRELVAICIKNLFDAFVSQYRIDKMLHKNYTEVSYNYDIFMPNDLTRSEKCMIVNFAIEELHKCDPKEYVSLGLTRDKESIIFTLKRRG